MALGLLNSSQVRSNRFVPVLQAGVLYLLQGVGDSVVSGNQKLTGLAAQLAQISQGSGRLLPVACRASRLAPALPSRAGQQVATSPGRGPHPQQDADPHQGTGQGRTT